MINKRRVKRFRALIQFVLFLLVVVPVILIITLCFRIVGMLGDMSETLARSSEVSAVEQAERPPALAPDSQMFTSHEESARQPSSSAESESAAEESSREENTTEPATAPAPTEALAETGGSPSSSEPDKAEAASTEPQTPGKGASVAPVPEASPGEGDDPYSGSTNNPLTGF